MPVPLSPLSRNAWNHWLPSPPQTSPSLPHVWIQCSCLNSPEWLGRFDDSKSFTLEFWEVVIPNSFNNSSCPTLSAHISPAAIKGANKAVRNMSQGSSKPRGKYAKFTPEQEASIGEYASLHSIQAAIHHFWKQSGVEMKPTSVQTWKGKYLAKSAASGKLVRWAISVSSPCPSRSVGDFATRYWHVYLLGGVELFRAHAHTIIRIQKLILKALQPFIQKFALSKISHYTIFYGFGSCGAGQMHSVMRCFVSGACACG